MGGVASGRCGSGGCGLGEAVRFSVPCSRGGLAGGCLLPCWDLIPPGFSLECLTKWQLLFCTYCGVLYQGPRASQVVLVVKNSLANAGDIRDKASIPESERSPGGGHDNALQHSCLKNPTHRGAWQAMVRRVAKSWTRLK